MLLFKPSTFHFQLFIISLAFLASAKVTGQTAWRSHAHVVSGFVEYANQADEGIQIYDLGLDSIIQVGKGLPFHVESTTATLSDQEGKLRAFSNGCGIYRSDFSPMPGGELINPGTVHTMSCGTAGYIADQGAFFIDKPGAPGTFFLIHAGMEHLPDKFLHVDRIFSSEIDFNSDSAGIVIQSNVLIAEGDLEHATATRHGNGRDWWLLVPVRHSPEVRLFLITPTGIIHAGSQWLSDHAAKEESRWAFTGHCFSPDGHYWARYNTNTGLYLYHFDRCSGILSDLSRVPFPTNDEFGGGGVLFSMNSQFVYLTHQRLLYRVDIANAPSMLDTVYMIGGGTGGTFHRMFAGPEGNILVSPMARATHWHVLEHTDAADPNQVSLKLREKTLPFFSVRSVPHVINLQLGKWEASSCDSLSVSIDNNTTYQQQLAFRLFPNPASDHVRMELSTPNTQNKPLLVQLYSIKGTLIYEGQMPPWAYIHEIPLTSQSAGMYMVKLSDSNGHSSSTRSLTVE